MALTIDETIIKTPSKKTSAFYLGDEINIELRYSTLDQPYNKDLVHTLVYQIYDEEPIVIVEDSPSLNFTWKIPTELQQKFKTEYDTFGTGKITVLTKYIGSETDVTIRPQSDSFRNIDFLLPKTDLDSGIFIRYNEVYDNNSTTVALTGDNQTFIKYFSNLYHDIRILSTKSLPHRMRYTIGGKTNTIYLNETIKDTDVTFPWISQSRFTVKAVESSELKQVITTKQGQIISFEWLKGKLIQYSKLTCRQHSHVFSADGLIKFTIDGNYFNQSFGAKSNSLKLYYRYYHKDVWTNWIQVTPTINENTYQANVTINDSKIDYKDHVSIQCKAEDALMTVQTSERDITGIPTFDWSKTDFRINVPTYHKSSVTVDAGHKILGMTANGEEYQAITPCDNTNNLIIGKGNYDNGNGSTIIYGNDIHFHTNGQFTLNGDNLGGLIKSLTSSTDLTVTYVYKNLEASDAANWNILFVNCSDLTLQNSIMYCSFNVTLSTRIPDVGMPSEGIFCGRVEFNNKSGLITKIREGIINYGSYGSYFTCRNAQIGSSVCTFDVYLTYANDQTQASYEVELAIPVLVNYSKF